MMNHRLKREPFQHQLQGMEAMINGGHGFCNFAEPGCGKTLMCIGALNHLAVRKVLVVCPNSLKYNWASEFEYSEAPWKVMVLEGSGYAKGERLKQAIAIGQGYPQTGLVVITNYESLGKLAKGLNNFQAEVVIADEIHHAKNPKAQKTKALKAIKSSRRWGLSGTPILNNPLDIWSPVDWVRPGHLHTNFYAFRARHAIIYTGAGFPMIKGFRNLDELKRKVDMVSWRVTKEECLDLPEKVWVERQVELSPAEARVYTQMAREMVAEVGDEEVAASTALVKLLRLTQITSGFISSEGKVTRIGDAKLSVLREILEELEGQKVVVWCHFKEEMRMIQEMLKAIGRPSCQLVAEDDPERRQEEVRTFQESELPMVMVASVQVGGVGITLTAASYVVYYSNTFSQGDRLQSQDRTHRIGTRKSVTYMDLVVPKSIDAYILRVLKNKAKLANSITRDDLRKMISNEE